jgi:hypothetical protein
MIDNRADPNPTLSFHDPCVAEYGPDLHVRRLYDGFQYRVVKVMYEPHELMSSLAEQDWDSDIDATRWFIYGSAQPR